MKPYRVGVIADTHGLLRPQAVTALQGSDLILHAGDVGDPQILETLRQIAPVVAVRGNVDTGAWAYRLQLTETVQAASFLVYMLHDLSRLDLNPVTAGIHVVISGHSHQPQQVWRAGVLYLNPGSAGPRRFLLPIALAVIEIEGEQIQAKPIYLNVD